MMGLKSGLGSGLGCGLLFGLRSGGVAAGVCFGVGNLFGIRVFMGGIVKLLQIGI
jgi:hypothetical protein